MNVSLLHVIDPGRIFMTRCVSLDLSVLCIILVNGLRFYVVVVRLPIFCNLKRMRTITHEVPGRI